MARPPVLLLLPLLLLAPAQPARADAIADRIAQMPGEVEEARIVGDWVDGDEAGAYRLVVARTGVTEIRTRLFVQWLVFAETGTRVKATQEIEELTELGGDLAETSVDMRDGALVLTLELAGPEKVAGTYEVIVRAPGDTVFGKTKR